MCLEHIQKHGKILEHEIWSSAHDAMNVGNDRGFKRLGWLLKESCPVELDMCLRIYNYEDLNHQQKVTAYQYDNGDGQPFPMNRSI